VVSRIIEVEPIPNQGGRLIEYPGNYRDFRKLRAERLEAQRRAWENQQTKFKQEEAYIRKYKAGQRAKQARGRESRLEREKATLTIEKPLNSSSMRLELPRAERTGDIVANVRGLAKAYPNEDGSTRTLFHDLDLSIERGQRWGILGPNGAGKTTLVRCLLGELDADAGSVSLGTKLSVGYFKQSHEAIDPDLTVVRYLQKIVRKECPDQLLSEQAARNLAGAFLFSGESQEKELGLLSGGERARAALAGLMASAKNVLVLDEPTNHLDIPSAERLEDALRKPEQDERSDALFEGTLILISHDRALLDACCDRLIVLDGEGDARAFLGTYSEWHAKHEALKTPAPRRNNGAAKSRPGAAPGNPTGDRRGQSPAASPAAPKASKSKWSWMRVEQLEEKIAFLEERIGEIDRALDDPDIWTEIDKANALTTERDELKAELEGVEAEWLRKAE
jgi:ATP-binding cassette subfamily F protein 3